MEIKPHAETTSTQSLLVQERLNRLINVIKIIEDIRDSATSRVKSKRDWIDQKKLKFSLLFERAKSIEEAHQRKVKQLKKKICSKEKEINLVKARIISLKMQTDQKEENVVTTDNLIE
jgi:SMC interacting uncharacterized protein involved in chromosome segregation